MNNKILYRFNLNLQKNYPRPSIVEINKKFGNKLLMGAEIGVFTGENAESILKTLNIKKLFLIDPYIEYKEYGTGQFTKAEKIARKKLKIPLSNKRAELIKEFSNKAEVDNDLDFVYIDGNHFYKFVKEDIEKYYGKLKVGGILAGHDFHKDTQGVIQAVIEFACKNNLKLYVEHMDWWIGKELGKRNSNKQN